MHQCIMQSRIFMTSQGPSREHVSSHVTRQQSAGDLFSCAICKQLFYHRVGQLPIPLRVEGANWLASADRDATRR